MTQPNLDTSTLFSSVELGPYTLKNRIVMPPLTRSRSTQPDNIPNELMASYYAQRASAGFMVTEGTQIEPRGQGYAWTPGIYSQAQIEGWKKQRKPYMQRAVLFLLSFGTLAAYRILAYSQTQPNLSGLLP